MRDIHSVSTVEALHPAIVDKVKAAIETAETALGPRTAIRVPQGGRTIAYQNELYKIGRTVVGANVKPGKPYGDIVTKARGGASYHNYFLAVDCCILYDKDGNGTFESLSWDLLKDFDKDGLADWMEMVNAFEVQGAEWGGRWKTIIDNPHFQWRFGHAQNCSDLYQKWLKKEFIPGTQFVVL